MTTMNDFNMDMNAIDVIIDSYEAKKLISGSDGFTLGLRCYFRCVKLLPAHAVRFEGWAFTQLFSR